MAELNLTFRSGGILAFPFDIRRGTMRTAWVAGCELRFLRVKIEVFLFLSLCPLYRTRGCDFRHKCYDVAFAFKRGCLRRRHSLTTRRSPNPRRG